MHAMCPHFSQQNVTQVYSYLKYHRGTETIRSSQATSPGAEAFDSVANKVTVLIGFIWGTKQGWILILLNLNK